MRIVMLLFAVFFALALSGNELLDFAELDNLIELPQRARGTSARVDQVAGRNAMRFFFDPAQVQWNEVVLKVYRRPELPVFSKCRITLEVWLPQNHAIRDMGIRLVDQTGEVLQYSHGISAQAHGWQEISWYIDAATRVEGSWGGGVVGSNGVIDGKAEIYGFTYAFKSGSPKGSILFGKVSVEIYEAPLETTISTGNGFPVVTRGREAEFGISLRNNNPSATKGTLKWKITASDGDSKLAGGKIDWEVAARSEKVIPLPAPSRYGLYDVCTEIDGGNKRRFRIAYMNPAGPVDGPIRGFVFGVCEHPEGASDIEADILARSAALCGARVMRGCGSWTGIEWLKGHPDYHAEDSMVERLGRYNMKLAPLLLFTPSWAIAKDWKPAKPKPEGKSSLAAMPDMKEWRDYVRGLAARLGDRLHSLEVWNEPDLNHDGDFSSKEYFQLLKAASEEIRAVAPGLPVQSGGLANISLPSSLSCDPLFAQKLLKDEAANYDIFSVHIHLPYLAYEEKIEELLAIRTEVRNNKPWYANETAVSSSDIGEEKQANVLFEKMIFTMAKGAYGYNWYNLIEKDRYEVGNPERHFGLLMPDLAPKAAYLAYNTVAGYFREAVAVQEYSNRRDNFRFYCFKAANGDWLLPGWNLSMGDTALLLADVTGKATRVDLCGNEEPLIIDGGSLMVSLNETPSFVRISGQQKTPRFLGTPLSLPETLILRQGEAATLRAVLRNTTQNNMTLTVTAEAPEQLQVQPNRFTRTLAPGKFSPIAFSIKSQKNFGKGKIRFRINPGNGVMSVPVERAVLLEKGLKSKPDLLLHELSQVTFLVPSADSTVHLRWKGPEDLSGKFYLSASDKVLTIRCDVTDDRHRQRFSGSEIWQNDSLQIALTLPEQNTFWEFGAALLDSGKAVGYCWRAPAGFHAEQAIEKIGVEVTRDEARKLTRYILKIPFNAIGLTRERLSTGIRFNALINDCDETATRESYLRLAPGLGNGTADPKLSPLVYR